MKVLCSVLLLLVLMCLTTHMDAQSNWLSEEVSSISSVDQILLPELDNYSLYKQYIEDADGQGPFTFAHKNQTSIDCEKDGTWESAQGDIMVWRQRIKSKGAYSLNIGFSDFYMPTTGKLFIYDVDKTHVVGPIGFKDNDEHGQWWSPIIPFDEVVIEIQVHPDQLDQVKAIISSVNHDFSGASSIVSGACNVDVICGSADGFPLIDPLRNIINSVGMYAINGTDLCTGALINTTRNDCTPYFLTANHCGVTQSNAPSVVIFWNYQNISCRPPNGTASGQVGNGQRFQSNSGTELIARYIPTDFTLLLLDDEVDPTYNPYYSGWDAMEEDFDSTYTIHHPRSEEKRISFDFDEVTSFVEGFFIRIQDWEIGTTEGGSSGSPLYSKEKRIIGQLNGGEAACGNDSFDDFGSLKLSWTGGGTIESSLKSWLDPDDENILIVEGRSCSNAINVSSSIFQFCGFSKQIDTIEITIVAGFENGANLSIEQVPEDVSVLFSSTQITEGNSVSLIVEVSENYSEPMQDIRLVAEAGGNTNVIDLQLDYVSGIAEPPVPVSPNDGATGLNFNVDFLWTGSGSSFILQISSDESFNTINVIDEVKANKSSVRGLFANTEYFWRLLSLNTCGKSEYSSISSFNTGDIQCSTYSNSAPLEITNQPSSIQSRIDVTTEGSIQDVNVLNITGKHTWVSDLEFRIISPQGTVVNLISTACDDTDDFLISFDDEAVSRLVNCPLTNDQLLIPSGSLSDFIGQPAIGTWILEIQDDVNLDGGSLDAWTLELCLLPDNTRTLKYSSPELQICQNTFEPITIEGTLSPDFVGDVVIEILADEAIVNSMSVSNPIAKANDVVSIGFDDLFFLETVSLPNLIQVKLTDDIGTEIIDLPIGFQEDNLVITLLSPANNTDKLRQRPEFNWITTGETLLSRLVVIDRNDPSSIVIDTMITGSTFQPAERLGLASAYDWYIEVMGNCSNRQSENFNFTTDLVTSSNQLLEDAVTISPNPFQGLLRISIDQPIDSEADMIRLYSINGQNIISEQITSRTTYLSLSAISPGLYFMELFLDGKRLIKKLVKE